MERGALPQEAISPFGLESATPPPVETPRPRRDDVPDWVLPEAFRLIEMDEDPIAVAVEHGIDSPEMAELCRRGYARVAAPAWDRCAAEGIRRMWDSLESAGDPVVLRLSHHNRETYFRDKTAWEAVFFEHVRRQTGGPLRAV